MADNEVQTGYWPAWVEGVDNENPAPAGSRTYDLNVQTRTGRVLIKGSAFGDFWPNPIDTLPLVPDRPHPVAYVGGNWYLSAPERPDFAPCDQGNAIGALEGPVTRLLATVASMSRSERAALRSMLDA